MRCIRFLCEAIVIGCLIAPAGCGNDWAPHDPPAEGGAGGSATTGTGGDLLETTGSTGGQAACAVPCVPAAEAPFERISMFTIDVPDQIKPCPDWAPDEGLAGYADWIEEPHTCPECTCSPAGCLLPETMYASAATCAEAESASVFFDAPAGWQGVCSADDAVPAGLKCGGLPCVESITIAAPSIAPCAPVELGTVDKPPPGWGKRVRECKVNVGDDGDGCPHGESCAPVPAEGFVLCVFLKGDDPAYACPDEYPDRHVVHVGDPQDERGCEPCACSGPQGGACSALVSMFTDGACGALLGSYTLTSAMDEGCFDLPAGVGLGSKAATWLEQTAGSCAPMGGQPVGAVVPTGPVTLCCAPAPRPTR